MRSWPHFFGGYGKKARLWQGLRTHAGVKLLMTKQPGNDRRKEKQGGVSQASQDHDLSDLLGDISN